MLKGLIRASLRFRGVVVALACMTVAHGLSVAARSRLDVFPEFAPPQVVIQTEAPGLSPEQVEQLVTRPVENAVQGVGNLESVRSESIQGLSKVIAVFADGTDVLRARQMVSERLLQVGGQLPLGVRAPVLEPLTSSTSLILTLGFTSARRGPMDLRTFVEGTVRPRIHGVPGVAKTVLFGGEERQIQIQISPERLLAYDLAIGDVIAAARESTGVLGAGFVESETQRIALRLEGQAVTAEQIGEAVVAGREGSVVRLRDVARVVDGPKPKTGDALVNGVPGVLLQVWAQYGTNTLEVTERVEGALRDLEPALQTEGIDLAQPSLFRPASFIETSVRNMKSALLLGGGLVAAVLTLFLFDLRTAFVSLTAIPLSLLVAVLVLDAFGATLNTLTLGGLAIAIGEVVDDAVIDVENIHRRLRENRRSGSPRSAVRVVLDASIEVRSAVVYATFVVALVFVPVLAMSGVQGKLFAPLGTAYILATMASLLVALTVTPALSLILLSKTEGGEEPKFLRTLRSLHRRVLGALSARPVAVMLVPAFLCAAAAPLVLSFGGELLPEFQEGNFIIQMFVAPGTSMPEMMRIGGQVNRYLLAHPNVRTVGFQAGRAELGEDTVGTDFGEFVVTTRNVEGEEAEKLQHELQRELNARFPGAKFAVRTFLAERIEETISGSKAPFVVRVYGNSLERIEQKTAEVAEILSEIPGAAGVTFLRPDEPQAAIRLDRERLKRFGFRPLEVMEAVQAAYQGATAAQIYDENRVFDVVVVLEPSRRKEPETVGRLLVRNRQGAAVRLGELADVVTETGRHIILHDGARRYQEVSCSVSGRDTASFANEAEKKIREEVKFTHGTYPEFLGEAAERSKAAREILRHSLLAGAGVLLLLAVVFRRPRHLLLVLTNLPFALVGGVFAAYLASEGETPHLSIGSLVGFVTLFGISMRNAIMMISHFEHLVAVERLPWNLETALRGASERMVPILMTASVTALGLLPIALGGDKAGREIEAPMAIVILGGLTTSTVLNLLVLPILAHRFGRFRPEEIEGA